MAVHGFAVLCDFQVGMLLLVPLALLLPLSWLAPLPLLLLLLLLPIWQYSSDYCCYCCSNCSPYGNTAAATHIAI